MLIPESPDLGLKQLKGRLGRFGRPQTIESLDRQAAAEEQNQNMLRQLFGANVLAAGTPTGNANNGANIAQTVAVPTLGHRESLHVKKLMHSLMSLSSPVPKFGAEAKRNCFKQ